jgi:uncharacterized membrane protein YqiK
MNYIGPFLLGMAAAILLILVFGVGIWMGVKIARLKVIP